MQNLKKNREALRLFQANEALKTNLVKAKEGAVASPALPGSAIERLGKGQDHVGRSERCHKGPIEMERGCCLMCQYEQE